MPGLLYEPDLDEDRFVVTPDYDQLLAEWIEAHPDDPDPRMGELPQWKFEYFLRLVNPPKPVLRGRKKAAAQKEHWEDVARQLAGLDPTPPPCG